MTPDPSLFDHGQYAIEVSAGFHHNRVFVTGWIRRSNPALAYHELDTGGFMVDHVPSGGAIAKFDTAGKAVRLIDALELENWDWIPDAASDIEKKQLQRIHALIELIETA